MRIDTSRLKKVTSEVSVECEEFIDRLRISNRSELLTELSQIETWTFGKCELYHWVDVLDAFDEILEDAAGVHNGNVWYLSCDNYSRKEIRLLLLVLKFTTLLIEHSFSRHLYNSIEHLTKLLTSNNMNIVLGVLNLLYMFSKRSNFISRLNITKKNALLARLNHIAESWGGKEHGFALAECCSSTSNISATASTFYFEYYNTDGAMDCIERPNLETSHCHPAELTHLMCCKLKDLDEDQKMHIFTRLRLSLSFERYTLRLKFVQARLQALSVLVYSNSLQENNHTLLYPGFLEELVELLEMTDTHLVEIRAAALRTLTSIIHLDRNPHFPKKPGARLGMIIDVTGAAFYHGFLPTLVRTCINSLTSMTNLLPVPNQNHFDDDDDDYGARIDVDDVNDKESEKCNDLDIQKQQKILQQLKLKNSPPTEDNSKPVPLPLPLPDDEPAIDQNDQNNFPLPLATALFSFLYHLASYETGGEALVSCGMMESLLRVINWPGYELEHITFVTRAVRVIDLITNIEMQSFQNHGGLNSFIGRLDMEVNYCREEHPFEIEVQLAEPLVDDTSSIISGAQGFEGGDDNEVRVVNNDEVIYISDDNSMSEDNPNSAQQNRNRAASNDSDVVFVSPEQEVTSNKDPTNDNQPDVEIKAESESPKPAPEPNAVVIKTCLPQRAALLKSMLNFLKKAIQDQTFSDSIRHVMEGTLPNSLRHIISNAEYYGPSLFLLATDVVTVYVFQEPSFLSSLQNNGLTDVVLQALLKKDVPATREVLGSLPNVFSALCLNARGLEAFVKYDPFDRLFKVLLSPTYLMAMRRRRSSDPMGDTASNLGNAMDELMRHQPSLKPDSTKAVIKLLEELVNLGTDPKYICWRANNKHDFSNASSTLTAQSTNNAGRVNNTNMGINNDAAANSSDEDDDDEEEASTSSHHNQRDLNSNSHQPEQEPSTAAVQSENSEREPVPLIDYILNVMKFVDAILSTNSTDDHCREFVDHGGLKPLISILSLPNLPVDSPITTSAQAVASVCKSILNLAHEQMVLEVGLDQLSTVVEQLKPLQVHIEKPGGSVLLRELANCPNIDGAFSNASYTPLLHSMSAVHGYIVMLVHICRTGQMEIRNLLLNTWSKDTRSGKKLLKNLVELYTALVWESTLLLALCTDDVFPSECEFGKEDLDKLPSDSNIDEHLAYVAAHTVADTSILPGLQNRGANSMEMDDETIKDDSQTKATKKKSKLIASPGQLKYIKALLGASSRLGRALAELFGNLVKLCVGSPMRRRGQNFPLTPAFTSPEAKEIARVLSYILVDGFSHDKLLPSPIPKLKLTFLICSVGFTGPMLFDDKRYAFHLMLHKFVEEGGLEAFFEMFRWALTSGHTMSLSEALENQLFPDGTGEFLDAWLLLLEKMVNPKAILESPHIIINRTAYRTKPEFDIIMYLVKVHCLAFEAVIQIWGMKPLSTYGVRMTESMMSILKHVIKGERIIRDKYNKRSAEMKDDDKAVTPATNLTPVVSLPPLLTRTFSVVNSDHLRQLMDMGFSEQHATEALLRTMSMFEATEYLLCHPPPSPPTTSSSSNNAQSTSQGSVPMEVDTNDITANQPRIHLQRHATAALKTSYTKCGPCPASVKAARKLAKYKITMDPPMYEEILDEFCDTAVDKSLYLMDQLPETIQKGTDLLVILYRRNPLCWRNFFLEKICFELISWVDTIRKSMHNVDLKMRDVVLTGELATKFFVRLQLCCFLMDDMYLDMREMICATINKLDCLGKLISCLLEIEELLRDRQTRGEDKITPKWLCQLLSFLDYVEKVNLITQRRKNMLSVTTRIWKWYDVASGKWNAYSVSNNKIIDQAYSNSDPSVRISCGRQRYTINFNCMSQVNEETGNHRPIILSLKVTDKNYNPENVKRTEKKKQMPSLNTQNADVISDTDSDDFNDQDGVNTRGGDDTNSEEEVNAVTPTQNRSSINDNGGESNQDGISANETGTGPTTITPTSSASQCRTLTNIPLRNREKPASFFVKKRLRINIKNGNRSGVSSTPRNTSKSSNIDIDAEPVGLYQYDTAEIVTCCVRLMQPVIGIDRDTLHAIMKLCVRLTKDFENAKVFAREGGVRLLLSMRQTCGYMGFPTFAILLIRHVLEEPKTLALAIERVIKARTIPTIPPGYRELLFLLRQMSSAVSRHPDIFKQVAHSMLRIDLSVLRRSTTINEDTRLMMKSEPPNPQKTDTMEESVSIEVVHDLLKALVKPCVHYSSSNTFKHRAKQNSFSFQVLPGGGFIALNLTRQQNGSVSIQTPTTIATPNSTSNPMPMQTLVSEPALAPEPAIAPEATPTTSEPINTEPSTTTNDSSNKKAYFNDTNSEQCCGWHIPSPSHDHDKPLLPRATILKFLADAVRSYQTFAPLVTKHIYKPTDSPLISENQTALSFVLDRFLPIGEHTYDREVSSMTRVFISSLASCSDQPGVQTTVVMEVKAAIHRALALPESVDKHLNLQILAGLIPAMIENCPPENAPLATGPHKYHLNPRRNEIFYVMIRQDLISDLTKLIQYLDLSSPHSIATINAAMKPLEVLMRLTNAPGSIALSTKKTGAGSGSRRHRNPNASQQGNSGSNNASSLNNPPRTGTIVAAAAAAAANAAAAIRMNSNARSSQSANLDEIMDQLLQRASNMENEINVNQLGSNTSHSLTAQLSDHHFDNLNTLDVATSSDSDSDSNPSENDEREDDETANTSGNSGNGATSGGVLPSSSTANIIPVQYPVGVRIAMASPSSSMRNTSGVLHLVPGSSGVSMPNPVLIGSSANLNSGVGISTVVSGNFNRRQHPVGGDTISNLGIVDAAASAAEITGDNENVRNSNGPSSIFRDATRVVLMDNTFGIFANTDEGSIDLVDQTGYLFGRSLAATLSSTPTALHWWLEEAKNLGMESQSDVCLVVAHQLIPDLEEFKARELLKLRLKRRKKQEEDTIKDTSGIPLRVPQRSQPANSTAGGGGTAAATARRDIEDTIEFQPLENNENFEQAASGDNARNFVIGMDTDSEDNTQANQRSTNERNTRIVGNVRANTTGEDSGGVSTNPATEAMSTTSTSEIDGNEEDDDEDDEDDDDDGEGDVEGEDDDDDDDDDDDEEDEEHVLSSGDDGSDIDVVTTYITPSRTNQSLITTATTQRRSRSGVSDGIHIVTVTVGNSASHSSSSGRIVPTGSVNHSTRTLNDEMAAAALVPLPPDDDDDDDDNDDGDEDGNGPIDFDDIENVLSHVHRMNDEPRPCIMHRPNIRRTITNTNRSSTNRENSQNQTNENQEDRVVSGSSAQNPTVNATEASTAAALASTSGTSASTSDSAATTRELLSAELREVLGDIEVPEGVDPSFLAALPLEMRSEVIAEHLRLQRIRQRDQQNAIRVEHASIAEVNPEFLAALPQNIQEEVLAQQRIEQQRQAAAAANPNDPVDTVAFFENLQPSLRQAILTDMEDSQISVLPPDLAAEAQNLRRDWESRNRQIIQERLINQIGTGGNSGTNATGSAGGSNASPMRYLYRRTGNVLTYLGPRFPTTNNVNVRPRWHTNSIWYNGTNGDDGDQNNSSFMALMERQGRPLLDHDALSTLLVLLFVDDPKFHTLRLHRVIRNLCSHVPTREWIIKSLLSIIEKTNDSRPSTDQTKTEGEGQPISLRPNWLNIRLEGALGSRTNVFLIQRDMTVTGPSSSSGISTEGYIISIHSQAAQNVCKHSLDLLITLAKMFPKNFLPYMKDVPTTLDQIATERMMRNATASGSRGNGPPPLLLPPPPCTSPTSNSSSTIYTFQTNTITNIPSKTSSIVTGAKQPSSTNLETDNAGSCSSSKMRKLNNSSSSSNNLDESMATESSPLSDNSTEGGPSTKSKSNTNKAKFPKGAFGTTSQPTNFWDILIKLDCNANQRKEASTRPTGANDTQSSSGAFSNPLGGICSGPKYSEFNSDFVSFDESPFGQLIKMLSFGIVRKSTQLTDKLLKLLSFISVGLPDDKQMWLPHPSTSEESNNAGNTGRTDSSLNDNTGSGHTHTGTSQATRGKISLSKLAFYYPNDRLKLTSVNRELLPTSESQLRLTIDVLTSKSCSEDGLEDATSLLLNMSQCSNQTRCIISNLLIRGAKELAGTVQKQIKLLMAELHHMNPTQTSTNKSGSSKIRTFFGNDKFMDENTQSNVAGSSKARQSSLKMRDGVLQDRFTREAVIITAPTKVKQTCDLQLSSMVPLISRTSSQAFFLRVLKVIIQIREAVREAATKPEHRHRIVLSNNELTPLSQLLGLHGFWDTLSDGLLELEHSNDHHAVLVLQPAVEAFFLVHASQQVPTKKLRGFNLNADPEDDSAENNILPIDSLLVGFTAVDENPNITLESLPPDIPDIPEIPPFRGQRTSTISSAPIRANNRNQRSRSETGMLSNDSETVVIVDSDSDDGDNDMAAIQSEHTSEEGSTANSRASNLIDDEDFNEIGSDGGSSSMMNPNAKDFSFDDDQKKFINFAEKHRTVLNQILRQSSVHLSDGPFAVLVDHTRILDFDVKRKYFRTELERLDEGIRREELAVHVHRVTVFEDSFRELYRRNPEEWKNRFYIVFEDEEGQDAGGLLREWYLIISREIFNPMYALFTVSPGDRVTYMINPSSHANPNHLCYYKFVGRVIAKAIHDNKLLECYFTRSFYKHILGIVVKYTDMESEDYDFYKGLVFLLENHISSLGYELTYSLEIQEFGVTEIRDLVPNGRNIPVTEDNKLEYIHLVCQLKMSGSIRQQLNAFLEGFYDIIPKRLISIFNEQELELLISGLPNVDIEDLKANTEYNKYQANSIQIQWFWRALRSFDQADRAKFLQFITGTSKVPLQGFAALEGMNGTQKFQIHRDDRSTERLPSAHTCFNQLDLPAYKTYDKLRSNLLKAIHECSEGFGFA